MRPASLLAGLAATLALAMPAFAQERPLDVKLDQATQVRLRAPAGSVIVANPRIADVTVTDARTLRCG